MKTCVQKDAKEEVNFQTYSASFPSAGGVRFVFRVVQNSHNSLKNSKLFANAANKHSNYLLKCEN